MGSDQYISTEDLAVRTSAPDQGAEPGGAQDRDSDTGEATDQASGDAGTNETHEVSLLDRSDAERFRTRWSEVQARFVDDPREAVGTADGLVAELMQSLAAGFADHKTRLEAQWNSDSEPDTEELRQALRRYRSFFERLLET